MAGFAVWNTALTDAQATSLHAGEAVAAAPVLSLALDDAPPGGYAKSVALIGSSGATSLGVRDFAADLQGAFTGFIAQPGQTDVYTFTLEGERRLYWDTLGNRSDIVVTLRGPGGVNISRALNATGANNNTANQAFTAPAGDYTLTVTGIVAATGGYGLRLLDLDAAAPLVLDGGEVSGTIAMRRAATAVTFEGVAGERVFIDIEGLGVSSSQAGWRLLDPFDRQILGPTSATDITDFTLPVEGRYTLVLETVRSLDPQAEVPWRIAIHRIESLPVALTEGQNPGGGPVLLEDSPVPGVALRGAEHLKIAHDAGLALTGSITLEAWVRIDNFENTFVPVIFKGDGSGAAGRAYTLWLRNNGAVHASAARNTGTNEALETSGGRVATGTWTHVAAVFDRAEGRQVIYVNGVEAASRSMSVVAGLSVTDPLMVGRTTEDSSSFGMFDGAIGEVRVWSVARSAEEIAAAAAAAITGAEEGLALWLPLGADGDAPLADPRAGGRVAQHVDLNAGGITGTIGRVGQELRYILTLDAPQLTYIDSLTNRSDLRLRLTGPAGQVLDRHLAQIDSAGIGSGNPVYALPAGDYTLTVTGTGDATGNFNIALIDLADAQVLDRGSVAQTTLEPASRTALYAIESTGGERVFIDHVSGSTNVRWRLIDPFGTEVFGNIFPSDRTNQLLAREGTYVLLVEGRVGYGGAQIHRVAVYDMGVEVPAPLVLGTRTTAEIDQPGRSRVFTFDLAAPADLVMDVFDNVSTLRWTLDGPDGRLVSSRAFSATDAERFAADAVQRLAAGSYRLTVTASDDSTGSWDFRLIDLAAAALPLAVHETRNGSLGDGGFGTRVYALDLAKGQRIELVDVSSPSFWTSMRLIDPAGYQVLDGQRLLAGASYVAHNAGTHYFLVEGNVREASHAGIFAFQWRSIEGADATGASFEDFEGGAGIPHLVYSHSGPAPSLENDGAGNSVLRLLSPGVANHHTGVAFGQTASGLFDRVVISADIALEAPGAGLPGEAVSLIWARTNDLGRSGPLPAADKSNPNLGGGNTAATLVLPATADGAAILRLRYSSTVIDANLADLGVSVADLLAGAFTLRLQIDAAAGGGRGTVDMVLDDGRTIRTHDAVRIPWMLPWEGRAALQAGSGPARLMGVTVDNVSVTTTAAAAPSTLTLGQEVSGAITDNDGTDRYWFEIDRPTRIVADALTDNTQLRWSISVGPSGVDTTSFTATDSIDRGGPGFYELAPGLYSFNVWTNNASTGSYAITLHDMDAGAVDLALGAPVTGTLPTGRETHVYAFDWPGDAGFYLETQGLSGPTAYWRLIDPAGNLVQGPTAVTTDYETLALSQAGRYTLLVEGRRNASSPTEYRIGVRLSEDRFAPMELGEIVTGTIPGAGDRLRFTFTLDEPAMLLFDSLSNRSDMQWALVGPAGNISGWGGLHAADSISRSDAAVMAAVAGDYQLFISGTGSATGNIGFILHDLAQAEALPVGEVVTRAYDPANSSRIFSFDAEAGSRYFLDYLTGTLGSTGRWKIVDSFGGLVMNPTGLTIDVSSLTIPRAGTHYLIVEGRVTETGTGEHSFRLLPLETSEVALTLDEVIAAALNLPGETARYTFMLDEPGLLYVDAIAPNSSAFRWMLSGPRGQEDSRVFSASDGNEAATAPLYALPAGEYRLTVSATGGTTGAYALAVRDAGGATLITPGTPVEGQVAPGGASRLFAIDVQEGERFFFDSTTVSSASLTTWRLIDPYGREVFRTTLNTDVDTITLDESGRYLLLVEGRIPWPDDRPFSFNIYAVEDSAPIRLSGLEAQPGPDLVISQFALDTASELFSGGPVPVRWTITNAGDEPVLSDFSNRVTIRRADTGAIVADVVVPQALGTSGRIDPGGSVTGSVTLTLPPGVAALGELVATLRVDTANEVDESNPAGDAELNNAATLGLEVALAPFVDLVAQNLVFDPPAGWTPGAAVTVTWATRNDGSRAALGAWTERVIVNNRSTGRVAFSQDIRETGVVPLEAGAERERTLTFGWPGGIDSTGLFDLAVVVDVLGEVFESNQAGTAETNNSLVISRASAPDLVVEEITLGNPAPAAGEMLAIFWVLRNEGAAATPGDWTDRVILRSLSTGQIFHNVAHGVPGTVLEAGETVTRSLSLKLPDGAAGVGNFRVEIRADSNTSGRGALNEARDGLTISQAENNNSADLVFSSVARQYADLVATIVATPSDPRGGETVPLTWRVLNAGSVQTDADGWVDRLWLSLDDTLDDNDILLGEFTRGAPLAPGDFYEVSTGIELPTGIEGDVHLFVQTDAFAAVTEPDTRADNTAGAALTLSSPHADLVVQAVIATAGGFEAGDEIAVSWRVANLGPDAAVAPAGGWTDRVYLSTGTEPGPGDVLLGSFTRMSNLAVGESYSRAVNLALPPGVVGTFRVLVVTDATAGVYERDKTANNARASDTQITLSPAPAPDLAVVSVSGPENLVPGQQAEVRFTIRNDGEAVARGPWQDQIRLLGPGLGGGAILANISRAFDLAPGASYEVVHTVTVPANLGEGAFRFEVRADRLGQVFEAARTANNILAGDETALRHPNLVPTVPVLPAAAFQSGDAFTVEWSVSNTGAGGAVAGWTDRVWLSRTDVRDSQSILLGEVASPADLPFAPGQSVTMALDVALPISVSGAWFIIVETDALGQIAEPGAEDDNSAARAIDVALAPYADLGVTEVTGPALTVGDPARVNITWTVENSGPGAGITDTWVDRIFVSADDIIGNADDIELARVVHEGGLGAGDTYTKTQNVVLPPGFNGRFTLYVRSDADGAVFENGLKGNNLRKMDGYFDVAPIPYADLVVESVEAPATALSGQPMTLRWTVRNDGIGLTNKSSWNDEVFIADNPEGTGRIKLGNFNHIGFLAPDASYIREAIVTLPEGWTGPAHFFVKAPGTDRVVPGLSGAPFEFVYTDAANEARSGTVDVALTPPPNLVVTQVTLPATAPEGSAIDVTWRVHNAGTGPANGSWTDRVILRHSAGEERDVTLGTYTFTGPLAANTGYERREQVMLPTTIAGVYELVVVTDFGNTVYEHDNEDDNESTSDGQIIVTVLPRPDLQVFQIDAPDTITAGATGIIRWNVINQGPVATTVPKWNDSVYLSLDEKISFDDIRLGTFSNEAALAPGEQYVSQEVSFRVPDRFRGTVYLIVHTDSGNAVDEWPNEGNNIRVQEMFVEGIPLADLVVHDVVTPAQSFEGNEVTFTYSVTNRGAGATNIGNWAEQIWLTKDRNRPHPSQGDVLLRTLTYTDGILDVGAGYDRTVTCPPSAPMEQFSMIA